jgi:hypothetical protein
MGQEFSIESGKTEKLTGMGAIRFPIGTDESGIYYLGFKQGSLRMGVSTDHIFVLKKYDLKFKEIYSTEYQKKDFGYDIRGFFLNKGKLYFFAYSNSKKTTVYGAEVNKETGRLKNQLKEICSIDAGKTDPLNFPEIFYNQDSSKLIFKLTKIEKGKRIFSFFTCSEELSVENQSIIEIKDEQLYEPVTTNVTSDNKIIISAKNYIYANQKKQSQPEFSEYSTDIYDNRGALLYSIKKPVNEKHVTSQKVFLNSDKTFYVTGSFSNDPVKKVPAGIFLNEYKLQTGSLISSTFKELTEIDLKKEWNNETESSIAVRSIERNPLNGTPVLLAELFSYYGSSTSIVSNGISDNSASLRVTLSHIALLETDNKGTFSKIAIIPKKQVERERALNTMSISASEDGRGPSGFSSFYSYNFGNKLLLFLNDHPSNITVVKSNDQPKTAEDMRKTSLFVLIYDFQTGIFSRKLIPANTGGMVTEIRTSTIIKNEVHTQARLPFAFGIDEYKFMKILIK